MKKNISIKNIINQMQQKIEDLNIKVFHFNFIQVNCYVLYDDTQEAIIIDAGNFSENEDKELASFIAEKQLKVKYIVSTHPHIDHVLGNGYCKKAFPSALLLMHPESLVVYRDNVASGLVFGIHKTDYPEPDEFINEGDVIAFGNQQLEVVYTPGHCDGSVCLIDHKHNIVFVGDVLFADGIGRTDLPTGNYQLLIDNIKNKLFSLNDEMVVCSGHGVNTTI
ncbi:MAG: MBL fold metallo-hydrolase, partial [Bacteroidales bacterium]|nr:MBL fold metallo-hydrolase [Bacteroidales bacterium]